MTAADPPPVLNRAVLWVILAGCAAVLTIDTIGSLISQRTGFEYGLAVVPALVTYCVIGVLACRHGSIASSAVAGAVVGFCDATLGWWISWQIGPGRVDVPAGCSPAALLFMTGFFSVSLDATFATVAGAIYERNRRRNSDAGIIRP